jgi:hypothetical protein
MTIQIELWHLLTFLIGLLLSFLAFTFAIGTILLAQVEKQLDSRFAAQEAARSEAQKHWDLRFGALETAAGKDAEKYRDLQRELLELKAELPERFVRRDDYIHNQTVIEAKIDGLALRIENALLKGSPNG